MYESRDLYRIVAADGGGVRMLMPGGFATTAIEVRYPDVAAARAGNSRAIRDGLPAVDLVDETTIPLDAPTRR